MRNTIAHLYCTRDRNTVECPMHTAYINGLNIYEQLKACLFCQIVDIELTDAGNSLRKKGLPRLSPGMDLSNYEQDVL